jgi:hypothetical protein
VTPEKPTISGRHKDTLRQVFAHPLSHNVEWRAVLGLLREVASVEEHHDGHIEVKANSQTVILARPHQKDLDPDDVVTVRHLLTSLGYEPEVD